MFAAAGLLVYAGGISVVCGVCVLFLSPRLETPRLLRCLGFWCDFYGPKTTAWEGLRFLTVQACMYAAVSLKTLFPIVASLAFVSAYGVLVLFFRPYGAEFVQPW